MKMIVGVTGGLGPVAGNIKLVNAMSVSVAPELMERRASIVIDEAPEKRPTYAAMLTPDQSAVMVRC